MKLYLVRHGQAVSESVDAERPLSPKGQRDIQNIAQYLKQKSVDVYGIFHSPLKRAQQTAEIIRHILNPSVSLTVNNYLLPDDPVDRLEEELRTVNVDSMVVGHLPFLGHLTAALVGEEFNPNSFHFDTGTVVLLERNQSLKWKMIWHISPKTI